MLSLWILVKPLFGNHRKPSPASHASPVTLLAKTHTRKDMLSVSHLPHVNPLSTQALTCLGRLYFCWPLSVCFGVGLLWTWCENRGQNNDIPSYKRTGKWRRGRRDEPPDYTGVWKGNWSLQVIEGQTEGLIKLDFGVWPSFYSISVKAHTHKHTLVKKYRVTQE